jgi:antitoxin ParD1/3/4
MWYYNFVRPPVADTQGTSVVQRKGAPGSPVFPSFSTLAMFANHDSMDDLEGESMPTRNVNLTEQLDRFVLAKVESGRYENASEVVRTALRALEREEQEYEAKLVALRAAIDEGDKSGIAGSNTFARVRKTLNLTRARR